MTKDKTRDPKSTTSKNLLYIKKVSDLDPCDFSTQKIKMKLPVKDVPVEQKWRLGLMETLMAMKVDKFVIAEDSARICAMLDSLCST